MVGGDANIETPRPAPSPKPVTGKTCDGSGGARNGALQVHTVHGVKTEHLPAFIRTIDRSWTARYRAFPSVFFSA